MLVEMALIHPLGGALDMPGNTATFDDSTENATMTFGYLLLIPKTSAVHPSRAIEETVEDHSESVYVGRKDMEWIHRRYRYRENEEMRWRSTERACP